MSTSPPKMMSRAPHLLGTCFANKLARCLSAVMDVGIDHVGNNCSWFYRDVLLTCLTASSLFYASSSHVGSVAFVTNLTGHPEAEQRRSASGSARASLPVQNDLLLIVLFLDSSAFVLTGLQPLPSLASVYSLSLTPSMITDKCSV